MADQKPATPDYDLAETLELDDPAQYRALFEDTRLQIVSLLLERAATTSELAQVLNRPKGTIGHHLAVLREAGLVHVVRTRRVRALEAKYYGRTARVFLYRHVHEAVGEPQRVLAQAASEIARQPVAAAPAAGEPPRPVISANQRYARIPAEQALEWLRRLNDLLVEFSREPAEGEVTYALVFGLYPTARPPLPDAGEPGEPSEPGEPG